MMDRVVATLLIASGLAGLLSSLVGGSGTALGLMVLGFLVVEVACGFALWSGRAGARVVAATVLLVQAIYVSIPGFQFAAFPILSLQLGLEDFKYIVVYPSLAGGVRVAFLDAAIPEKVGVNLVPIAALFVLMVATWRDRSNRP